jgi:hypothetical protein
MKTTLLLNDETGPAKLVLHENAPANVIVRESAAVAGCTCDRWGHPCPGCDESKVQPKTKFASSSPAKQTS